MKWEQPLTYMLVTMYSKFTFTVSTEHINKETQRTTNHKQPCPSSNLSSNRYFPPRHPSQRNMDISRQIQLLRQPRIRIRDYRLLHLDGQHRAAPAGISFPSTHTMVSAAERICAHYDVGLGHAYVYCSGMSCFSCLLCAMCLWFLWRRGKRGG